MITSYNKTTDRGYFTPPIPLPGSQLSYQYTTWTAPDGVTVWDVFYKDTTPTQEELRLLLAPTTAEVAITTARLAKELVADKKKAKAA